MAVSDGVSPSPKGEAGSAPYEIKSNQIIFNSGYTAITHIQGGPKMTHYTCFVRINYIKY